MEYNVVIYRRADKTICKNQKAKKANRGDTVESGSFDLLYGGGYSIKDYYMESGNPRQMRGASELLNDSVVEIKEKLMKDYGVPDEHIITGGATLYALVPRGCGEKLAKEAEDIFRGKCRTANAAFVAVPNDGDYETVKKSALAKYESRKAMKFTSWDYQNAKDSRLESTPEFQKPDSGWPSRCPRCRLRDPKPHPRPGNGEEQYLCESCYQRQKESNEKKYLFRKQCGFTVDDGHAINTLHELADKDGRVALLYADINNLGEVRPYTFDDDRIFHKKVEEAVKSAVCSAVRKAMDFTARNTRENGNPGAKFEIIALGGDDICLLLPGDVALLTARTIASEFDGSGLGLTVSVAACVVNENTALTYAESIVNKSINGKKSFNGKGGAKKYAHAKQAAQSVQPAQSVVNLSFFERPSGLFPMTVSECDIFCDLLGKVKSSSVAGAALRNIAQARRELVRKKDGVKTRDEFTGEFDLFFRYFITRDVSEIKKIKPILEQISNTYKGENPWPDFVTWRGQQLGLEVKNDEVN